MITTNDIKQKMREVFTLEPLGEAKETILILGSCRCVPYLNYLHRYNRMANRPFRIHFIDPFNYHWNAANELVDMDAAIESMEADPRILEVLRNTTIFIHEHYENYGMFNTDKQRTKTIYWFGMAPRLDINIPNYNDRAILLNDCQIANLTPEKLNDWKASGEAEVERFCAVCERTSFPEFGAYFRENWRKKRFFWTINHITNEFTLGIFRMMNDKFLKLPLDNMFWDAVSNEDMYRSPSTPVTQHDIDAYGLEWR